jgi:hypothetical protein
MDKALTLQERIASLFEAAVEAGELRAAEHLLRALEEMEAISASEESSRLLHVCEDVTRSS